MKGWYLTPQGPKENPYDGCNDEGWFCPHCKQPYEAENDLGEVLLTSDGQILLNCDKCGNKYTLSGYSILKLETR